MNLSSKSDRMSNLEHEIKHHQTRYYKQAPEDKSPEQCRSHGRDHRAYRWPPQLDPRWTDAQIDAYWKGYNEE